MDVKIVSFGLPPQNYKVIDKYLSRSAQPDKESFRWLKFKENITDVINLRTMVEPQITYDEKKAVEILGMKYHNIPSITSNPDEKSIVRFLNLMKEVKTQNRKALIHCKVGVDRTGMYAFIYKCINKIGSVSENIDEWVKLGHNYDLYPTLIPKTKKILAKLGKNI